MTSQSKYFVLYARDIGTEKSRRYGDRMLYDKCKQFNNAQKALEYASNSLPSIMGVKIPIDKQYLEQARDPNKPFVVVARHEGKYNHEFIDGSSDALIDFDAIRCNESELESTVDMLSQEPNTQEVFVGLELEVLKQKIKIYAN